MTLLSSKCLKYVFKKDMTESGDIFKIWYHTLKDLKKEFPKNKLIKKIASTTWGEIQRKNNIIKNSDEMEEFQDFSRNLADDRKYYLNDFKIRQDDKELYYLIDKSKPIYKYQYRLKPFLTSYARHQMALLALKNIDNVVRIQTDSITYDKDIDIEAYLFKRENDKSGYNFQVKGNSLIKLS